MNKVIPATLLAVGLAITPAVAHADNVLTYPGWEIPGGANVMPAELQGSLCAAPNTCEQVAESYIFMGSFPLPQGVYDPAGEAKVDAALKAATGPTIGFGYSAGASVMTQWIRDHGNDPNAPDPSKVSFVFIGDSNRVGTSDGGKGVFPTVFGNGVGVPTNTQYPVTMVTQQYDGWADWPTNSLNLLADANAMVGMNTLHPNYQNVNPNAPGNIVTKKGNVTDVLVPTPQLPLVGLLNGIVPAKTLGKLNTILKPLVDAGYQKPSLQNFKNTVKAEKAAIKSAFPKAKAHPIRDALKKLAAKLGARK